MINTLFRILSNFRRRYRIASYDDFTIAEHLRLQGAQIGERCRIIVRDLGTEPFLVSIGDHCTIASNVAFITHDGGTWIFTDEKADLQKFGRVDVLDNCFIGVRSTLMPNVRIGPNAIVAAGSIVTKDVPPNTVVAGCPARVICSIEEYRARVESLWSAQKPPNYMADLAGQHRVDPARIQQTKTRDFALLREHLSRLMPPPR